jgi:hypothetical protein
MPFQFWKRLGLPSIVVLNVIAREAKQAPTSNAETPALACGASVASSQTPLLATVEEVIENVE